MNIDNSINDVYRLVLPTECSTFINIHWQQKRENCNVKHQEINEFLILDGLNSLNTEKCSSISKVDCLIIHLNFRPFYRNKEAENNLFFSENFLEKLYSTMKPGASLVIKGKISFEFSVRGHRLRGLFALLLDWLKQPSCIANFSSCVKFLKAKGFNNVKSFYIVSGWNNPHNIVSTDAIASKYFFSTYIEGRREKYTFLKYHFIKLLITSNLIRYIEKNFLVVAKK